MYCAYCGAPVTPGQKFCSQCGQPYAGAGSSAAEAQAGPPQPSTGQSSTPPPGLVYRQSSRVARQLNLLGLLWIIFSGLRLIPGLALLIFGQMHLPFMTLPIPEPMRMFLTPFLGVIGLLISGFAIAGVIAGWGLMAHYPWARMLAIVLGCISLIHFPFGTALGVYTLWVLLPAGADVEYRSLARIK